MQNEIRGETIFLRSYKKEDAGLLFDAGREASRDADFWCWMPWCHPGYSRQESESFVGHSLFITYIGNSSVVKF